MRVCVFGGFKTQQQFNVLNTVGAEFLANKAKEEAERKDKARLVLLFFCEH